MKKVLCNKIFVLIVVNSILLLIYAFLIPITYVIFGRRLGNLNVTYIFIPIYALLYVILHIVLFKKISKKMGIYMFMSNNTITYNNKIYIPRIMITKIIYRPINIDEKTLEFHLCDGTVEQMYMSKYALKQVIKAFDLNVIHDKESRKKYKINKREQNKLEITSFLRKNKYPIIFCIIGLILTIASFILHNKINNNLLKTIICIMCIACGWSQLYLFYVRKIEDDVFTRIVISTIAAVVILVIMSILLMLLLNDINEVINLDCILFTIYLFPSFIIIGLLLLLIMSGM